ncbi:alpha/beta hydrolase [Bradyrhizobium sp.]|jgi:pimeloyl-ACP methyl ester carboxylesterase|uniref:alpha/beta fold hydrolase n=1 Tax=Bradyrhizobium sp. TaxID=376 RepID=UPI002B872AD9|nr:alpha/beta hydrolase [Bradyrhizobium sp.]HWX63624.1 alpha/beta hydrolase [Bradyrhizobium sp.]
MPNTSMQIKRRFVPTKRARIHVAIAGQGEPLLLLHQTPRSWDEFRDALPLLGQHYHVIAMDTVGFGDSDALPADEDSIESWAACAFDLLDALGVTQVVPVGHHTGAAIAIEMAAACPERVRALVLSAPPFVDAARRAAAPKKVIDEASADSDGSHLLELWRMRQPYYPAGDAELLERFMIDALKAGRLAAEGHRAVGRYVMETRLPLVTCPTLVIAPTADPHAHPVAGKVTAAIAGAELVEIPGGMVPFPDQMPEVFAATTLGFLDRIMRR